ncbi:MAG: rhodanese-like domain-containing protein [Solirubrobacteraceae bacterium]
MNTNLRPAQPPSLQPLLADVELRSGRSIALDVRERREYNAGTISGARYFPIDRLDRAQLDSRKRYVTICTSGSRSAVAAQRLREAGFDAVWLAGGLNAWRGLGFPVTSRTGYV